MDKNIKQIIEDEDITSLYQPIVNLITGEVMGYEALSRGPEWSTLFSPLALIEEAEKWGLSSELDYVFRKKAIDNISGLEKSQRLFININPNIMKMDNLAPGETKRMLSHKALKPSNVVLELTERAMISDYNSFNKILNHYKNQDYKIAIDDVGAGYSGLRTIKETQPHFIKIDIELIRDIDKDSFKEALLNAFLNFSVTTNIRLIAEGIETEGELTKLIEMGVHYGQGFYLQRPSKTLRKMRPDVINVIKKNNNNHKNMHLFRDAKDMVGNIVNKEAFADHKIDCMSLKKHIEKSNHDGVCILENNKPVGIVMRENLLSLLSSRYGLSLYAKKGIDHVMDIDFLMVDYHTSISEVSTQAMARDKAKTYDIVVITKDGEFFGIISINALLRHLITVETQIAQELNPLTRLPGNIVINRVLNDLIVYKKHRGLIYLDFDNFKPYNDHYGFESGDQFIKKVSELIQNEIKTSLPYNSFVGHIGGDDFIFVLDTSREETEKVCHKILKSFEEIKPSFYTPKDYERGCITAMGRDEIVTCFGLVTLSMSGLYSKLEDYKTVAELSKHMSDIKKEAKSIAGNVVIIR